MGEKVCEGIRGNSINIPTKPFGGFGGGAQVFANGDSVDLREDLGGVRPREFEEVELLAEVVDAKAPAWGHGPVPEVSFGKPGSSCKHVGLERARENEGGKCIYFVSLSLCVNFHLNDHVMDVGNSTFFFEGSPSETFEFPTCEGEHQTKGVPPFQLSNFFLHRGYIFKTPPPSI